MILPLLTYAIIITWILKLHSKVTMSESVVLFDRFISKDFSETTRSCYGR